MIKFNEQSDKQVRMSVNTNRIVREENSNKDDMVISGYAVVFNEEYQYNGWIEKVDPKAFDDVNMRETLHLRDHDYSRILGRNGKNTTISVDDVGLFFRTKLPNTELGRETMELANLEICDQCSIGFTIKEMETDPINKIDIIKKVDELFEITITPIPACKTTVVTTLSQIRTVENIENNYKQKMEELLK